MTITFVGHGYVGLVSASIFADLGNTVWVVGHTPKKVENLKKGIIPIYEPGLEEIVKRNVDAGRLLFTLDYVEAIEKSQAVFIAVGTPPQPNGEADLAVVFEVAKKIGENLKNYAVIITKSTVPVGTNRKVKEIIAKATSVSFDIASCPEFLREGEAIDDTLHPDRVVIGTENQKAQDVLVELHKPLSGERVLTNIETAEMIKYAANAFLATKISFANAIAELSELTGANGIDVLRAIGLDRRIGKAFLNPGAGYGGSCFPKDVRALIQIAQNNNYDFTLLKEVVAVNTHTVNRVAQKAVNLLGGSVKSKKIGVLGLAFKPDTDDMRDAPSISIINELKKQGAEIVAYDPISMENTKKLLSGISFAGNAYDVAKDADLLLIVTEWNEFKELDLKKIHASMKSPILLDARNIFDPKTARALGFTYQGVGR